MGSFKRLRLNSVKTKRDGHTDRKMDRRMDRQMDRRGAFQYLLPGAFGVVGDNKSFTKEQSRKKIWLGDTYLFVLFISLFTKYQDRQTRPEQNRGLMLQKAEHTGILIIQD